MADEDRTKANFFCRLPPELLLEIAELAPLSGHSRLSLASKHLTQTLQQSLFRRGGSKSRNDDKVYGPTIYGSTHMNSNAIIHRVLSYELPPHIDEPCANGHTYLAIAADNGCITAVSYLLSHGAKS